MTASVPSETHNRLLARGTLQTIELAHVLHDVGPTFREVPDDQRELALGGDLIAHQYHPDLGVVVLMFQWEVTVRHAGAVVLQVMARYAIAYGNVPNERAEDVVPVFARIGRYAVYAYFRVLVSVLLGQANVMLPVLPVLREGGATAATPGEPSTFNTPVDLVAPGVPERLPKGRAKDARGRRKVSA
jgi:hypothetical protein